MKNSKLVPMVRGYLLVNGKYENLSRDFLDRDADQIANQIRNVFGTFDESDQERCATVIRVVMSKAFERKTIP